jgi:tRNA threonylcarbamoyladenosine biosynthesis protein TsaE
MTPAMVDPVAASPPVSLQLSGPDATRALAATIAAGTRPGDVIALRGALGAGKTVFARGFIEAFARLHDAPPPGEIPSPTYTLAQVYEFPGGTVVHFDLYRLKSASEAHELGIEDAFADAISLIEWPDRLGALLPADRLEIELRDGAGENARIAEITGLGAWSGRVAEMLGDG